MDIIGVTVALVVGLAVGLAVGFYGLRSYQNSQGNNRKELADAEARSITDQAKIQSETLLKNAEAKARGITEESEQASLRRRRELDKEDERMTKRREEVDNLRAYGTARPEPE